MKWKLTTEEIFLAAHRCVCHLLILALVLPPAMMPTVASAASYDEAFNFYMQADFKNCIRVAKTAVNNNGTTQDKAKVLKIMGICNFMIKNKSSAAIAFKNAVKLDQTIVISEDEVLDPDVIAFFNDHKADALEEIKSKAAAKAEVAAQKSKKTTIQINVNAPARIMIDGLFGGESNEPIESEPGSVNVVLSAPGYKSKKLKLKVAEGIANVYTVTLTKAKSKKVAPPVDDMGMAEAPPTGKKKKGKKTKPAEEVYAGDNQVGSTEDLNKEFGTTGNEPAPVVVPTPTSKNTAGTSKKKNRRRGKTPPSTGNIFYTLMPFGAGQFQNGHHVMGWTFLGLEAGALAFSVVRYTQTLDQREEAQKKLEQIEDEYRAAGSTDAEIEAAQKQYLEGKDGANNLIADLYDQSMYGLYGFGLLWVAGVVEAMINEPAPAKRGAHRLTDEEDELAWGQGQITKPYWDVDLHLDPITSQPVYGIGAKIEF